ncbi:MAG: DUF3592 domain-containing protein [Candidatus Rifleibacteriota bacterium]
MAKITGEKVFKYIGLIIFLFGLSVFVYTIKLGVETSRQSSWPKAKGALVSAEFKDVDLNSYSNGDKKQRDQKSKMVWVPEFVYIYEVNGKRFTANRISTFDPTCHNQAEVRDLQRLVSRDQEVTVYYNPHNPSFSVLNPYPSLINTWIFLISSLIVGLVGFVIFWICRNAS